MKLDQVPVYVLWCTYMSVCVGVRLCEVRTGRNSLVPRFSGRHTLDAAWHDFFIHLPPRRPPRTDSPPQERVEQTVDIPVLEKIVDISQIIPQGCVEQTVYVTVPLNPKEIMAVVQCGPHDCAQCVYTRKLCWSYRVSPYKIAWAASHRGSGCRRFHGNPVHPAKTPLQAQRGQRVQQRTAVDVALQ